MPSRRQFPVPLRVAAVLLALEAPLAAEPQSVVGDTNLALPGVVRAPLVGQQAPRLAAALDVGYGWTEAQAEEGAHHRLLGVLGVGMAPLSWLEFALRVDARHDRHPDDGMGTDTGTTTGATVLGRVGGELDAGFRLGADVAATFPGSEQVGDSFSSPALDGRLLFGWAHPKSLRVAGFAGYRLDLTDGVAEDRPRYRAGDRLALGVSEFDALLVGLGLSVPLGAVELLAEVSGDLLVGEQAPGLTKSPLRANLGGRFGITEALSFEALGGVALSSRPGLAADAPLVPIEPRLSLVLGLRYRFSEREQPTPSIVAPSKPEASPTRKPKPLPAKPEPPPPPPTSSVSVTVVDKATGHPLSDAEVEIVVGEETRPFEFVTGSTFKAEQVPVGSAELIVRAERLRDWRRRVQVVEGEPLEVEVEMLRAANSGQIRGLVRGFDGKGLQARVQIEPGGHQVLCVEDGSFHVDVPPGDYQVEVVLEGYRTQKLRAKVGKDGVVVLNVDMIKGAR